MRLKPYLPRNMQYNCNTFSTAVFYQIVRAAIYCTFTGHGIVLKGTVQYYCSGDANGLTIGNTELNNLFIDLKLALRLRNSFYYKS